VAEAGLVLANRMHLMGRHGMASHQFLTLETTTGAVQFLPEKTAVIVVDMQNDFGSEGGMFHRAGLDISGIKACVAPTGRVLSLARAAEIRIVYLKMGFRPDLSDMGSEDAPNRVRHLGLFRVGQPARAPGSGRVLIQGDWGTQIVDEIAPEPGDTIVEKHRFSGFFETDLDAILKSWSIRHLIFTGCTTSVCVESTMRDAFFRDYLSVLLADCASEPLGDTAPRSNHDATLLVVEAMLGWVSSSKRFQQALEPFLQIPKRATRA
jgi:ureidoacrylate peracid hydrolase